MYFLEEFGVDRSAGRFYGCRMADFADA